MDTGLVPNAPTPKAVVKPQVLTHVIDGHIIKESSQPFPIPAKNSPQGRRKSEQKDGVSPTPNGNAPNGNAQNGNNPNGNAPNGTAPNGNAPNGLALSGPMKRGPGRPPGSTKNVLDQQRVEGKVKPGEPPEKKYKNDKDSVAPLTNDRDLMKQLPPPPPSTAVAPQSSLPPIAIVKNNPLKWNVVQVCDFIKNLPGCSDYAEDFALQEIDGQALMLLKADHLMSAMAIKLGPALKICSQIQQMREELNKN